VGGLADKTGSRSRNKGQFESALVPYNPSHVCAPQLLTLKEAGKRKEKSEEDIALLDQVKEANASAGQEYLEYLVLQRKSSSVELHTRLAALYAEKVMTYLKDETISKLWRAKGNFQSCH